MGTISWLSVTLQAFRPKYKKHVEGSNDMRACRIPREQLTPVAHPARAIAYLCTKEADDLAGKEFSLRDDDFRRRLELG